MADSPLILVADDHVDAVALIGQQLELEGYQHAGAYDGQETLERVEELRPDLLLLDMKMPELDGLQVIRRLRSNPEYDDLRIIVLTAERMDEADEIAGLDAGADDYLTKPINRSILVRRVRAMLRLRRLEAENRQLRLEVTRRHGLGEMVGTSKLMQDAYNLVEKVAPTDTFVLITGESGTGKELVASAIHEHSHRSSGPLVRVNLGSLSSNLVESELFGHEKGAFTGAVRDKKGKFELAAGGTIFLDEVGDIPLESQVKLLRVLQEREFDRVGGERTLRADVRVVAATNKDLEEEVEQGRFREDLYYRLDVIPIRLPALRERRDDILVLAAHFLDRHSQELGRKIPELTSEAKRLLLDYEWPGNVRQLDHEMMRVTTLSEPGAPITIDLLSEKLRSSGEQNVRETEKTGRLKDRLERIERRFLEEELDSNHWNQTSTARKLFLSRQGLIKKMQKYGLNGRTAAARAN
jgi:DNA-binding NtrC family response regulator